MKKKVLALLLVLSMATLAACTSAKTYTTVEILSKDGAGNKTIVVSIPKKNAEGEIDEEQEKFFPSGFDAVTDFIQEDLGDDFEVSFKELDESWDYTIKFSFSDVDDYNAKMKVLAGDRWSEIAEKIGDATIEAEEADGGHNITFRENILANRAATIGLLDRIYDQEDIFDPWAGKDEETCDIFGHENLAGVKVIVGDNSEELTSECTNEDPALHKEENRSEEDFELIVTGFVSADGASAGKTAGDEDKSPQTGDYGIVFAMIMLLASTVVLTSRKMVKSK